MVHAVWILVIQSGCLEEFSSSRSLNHQVISKKKKKKKMQETMHNKVIQTKHFPVKFRKG